jgi:hypothetical protein
MAAAVAPSGSDEARAYVQARLDLYARLMFAVSWVLVAFVIALYQGYPALRPPHDRLVLGVAIAGQSVFAAIWLALSRRRLSLAALYRLDAFFAAIIGVEMGVAAFVQCERYAVIYSALSFTVFARTIVMPSSGARTLAVSSISFAPLGIAAVATIASHPERLDMQPLPFLAGVVLFAGVAISLATTGSRVIYGLRRQVSEAMQLGQYTLEAKIGAGGMGAVYRARHAMLRRPTAIKLLHPDQYGPASLRRFEREVQTMSRLTHPNTVAIFDYGKSPDGVFYYVMELLDGVDLETLVALDGPQPAARVIHLLRQVCGALDEAHRAGLIHRDIKPANVILCRRGGKPDVAKVVDFGLVKELAPADGDTATTEIAGTPAYLAPEVITSPELIGARSDLYALGAVGYFLLTGQRVFDGKTAVHVCAQHVSSEPEPPSARTHNPIPAELEALVLRCLAKSPDDRPASAQAMRLALAAMPAYREWDESIAGEWWRAFEERRAPRVRIESTPLVTITRDLTQVDAAQPATTGHAT